jgi:hypothetical protein
MVLALFNNLAILRLRLNANQCSKSKPRQVNVLMAPVALQNIHARGQQLTSFDVKEESPSKKIPLTGYLPLIKVNPRFLLFVPSFPFNDMISGCLCSTRFLEQAGRRLYHLMIGVRNLWIKLGCLGNTSLGTGVTPYGEFCLFDRPLLPRLHCAPCFVSGIWFRDQERSFPRSWPTRPDGKGSNNRGGECR